MTIGTASTAGNQAGVVRGRRRPRRARAARVATDHATLTALAAEVRAFLDPLFREHHECQRLICRVSKGVYTVAADAPPSAEMHVFGALFMAELLKEATGKNWRVVGGSPFLIDDGRGGIDVGGSFRPHAWTVGEGTIIDITSDQYGRPEVVVCPASSNEYVANCSADDLERFTSRAKDWVRQWRGLWLRRQRLAEEGESRH